MFRLFVSHPPVMRNSPYTPIHAGLATLILLIAVFSGGFARFWNQFVYGLKYVMTPKVLACNLAISVVLYGGLLLFLWISTLFAHDRLIPSGADTTRNSFAQRLRGVKTAVCVTPFLAIVALALNWLGSHGIEWITGVKPADQELVKALTDGSYPLSLRLALFAFIILEAPLIEEPLFRGVIFRGFASCLKPWLALALSGFIFALVHVNASSFVALWYLGISFALLYRRTGTILAPMTVHALFNGANLLLLLLFPDLAR